MTRPRIRVAAIIVQEDGILLVRHEKEGQSYWLLPGGGVDYGETAAEALVRELKEEAGLDIRVRDLVLVNDSIPPDKHRHILNLCFMADAIGGVLALGQDRRVAEAAFVPVRELAALTLYPDVREELVRGIRDGFGATPAYLGNLWR